MAAPGLRITSAPRTPGTSHTPYMKPCAGGNAAKAAPVVFQSCPHAQNTTPKATAMEEATTMSTVRQRRGAGRAGSTAVGPWTAVEVVLSVTAMLLSNSLRWHYPDQVRGSAETSALSALFALPCGCSLVPATLAPQGRARQNAWRATGAVPSTGGSGPDRRYGCSAGRARLVADGGGLENRYE